MSADPTQRLPFRAPPGWLAAGASAIALGLLVMSLGRAPDGSGSGPSRPMPLVVACAASLKGPLEALAAEYRRVTGVEVQLQFGGSQTLLSGLLVSRQGDVFLPADEVYLDRARARDVIGERVPIAAERATIAVRRGNPKRIRTLDDLVRPDVRLVLANPEVAAISSLVREALAPTGRWEALARHALTFKPTVTDVAADLHLGAADAGLVWEPVLHEFPDLEAVSTPELAAVRARVVGAVLRFSRQPVAALRFLRFVAAPDRGLPVWLRFGFEPLAAGEPVPSPRSEGDRG